MHKAPSPPSLDELLSHMGWVRNLARSLVREEDAEDLAQETMLRAIQTPPKHGDNLRGWLAMISRNLTRSTRRKEARRAIRFEEKKPQPIEPPEPEELFARAEMAEKVRDLVERLDDNARYLILLRFHEGKKTEEIAQMLGISKRAAQSRLDRAMAKLRGAMRQHMGENYIVACLILAAPIGSPVASAVPAGTTAVTSTALSGTGMAALLKGLLAMAALLLPVYFIAFNDEGPNPDLEGTEELAAGLALQEPVPSPSPLAERTEVAQDPQSIEDSLIHLRVQDENGLPISDARLAVRKHGNLKPNQLWASSLDSQQTLISEFHTDENGLIAARLPADQKLSLFVGSRFFCMERLQITTPNAGASTKESVVTLKSSACLIGELRDGRGLPVPDAVVLLQRAKQATTFQTRSFEHRTVSSQDGSYELPSVPAGDYLLQVAHPHFERLISSPFHVESSSQGMEQVQNLQLSKGLTLAGKFEDSEGHPVAGASIWVLDPSELHGSNLVVSPQGVGVSGESASDGTFQVFGWSQARGSNLLIEAAGFLTKVIPADQITDHMQIILQRGLSLTIKVEKDRKPLVAAEVALTQRKDSRNSRSWKRVSQVNGRAHFRGLAPGFYQATVTDERGFGTTLPFELKNGGHEELLEIEAGAGFELLAVDSTGDPIPNVPVFLIRTGGLSGMAVSSRPSATNTMSVSGKTNSLGRFQIRLNPGKWKVMASPAGRSRLNAQKELAANQTTHLTHEFGLVGSLNVAALSPTSIPLKNLRLGLLPFSEGNLVTNRTDSNGKAVFRNLKAGDYSLFPWNDRTPPAAPPADAVKITIQAGEELVHSLNTQFVSLTTLKVLRLGLPVPGAQIRLIPQRASKPAGFDSRHASNLRTDGNGEWIASPLRSGNYSVIVRGSDNQPEQHWLLNLESGITSHEFHLEEFLVEGILQNSDGHPIPGVGVELERQIQSADGSILEAPNGRNKLGPVRVVSDSKGHFSFSAVPNGKWQIRVRDQAWAAPLNGLFEVKSNSLKLGEITLLSSCTLHMQLSADALHEIEARGGSIPQLELLHLQSQLRFQLLPDAQGRVHRSDLPAGDFELLVADRPSTPVRLSAEQVVELVLN